ncbi:hypothetical protein SDRG_13240 [Saprolegnia diclina VS20]|uniref:Fibronectin type-III domain-containing protein n=1 Tax=Saprolegnia diclina (strain VS20) TaxID=1156394 RepID=T0Q6J6_SAPDV|nr:hypothetical protein SDRG_13240 [Saprolegnia diclina VS20]EQC29080.1 hypothetical protein SDRG_13240 [Saprolegnia diclina VS20]|eukprot:XP_008617539.1 hypothetical protein SDRG_13240 [Saprolegnia diclina VS20]
MARLALVAAAVLVWCLTAVAYASSSSSSSYYTGSSGSYSYDAGSGSAYYASDVITKPGAYALPSQYANATPMALLDVGGGHMTFHWFTPATIDSMYLVYVNGSLTGHAFGITSDYTLEGLVCDATYIVVVVDVVNTNLANVLLATTTAATAPATPPAPVALHVDSGYVNISILYPKDTGGRPIEYAVQVTADAVDLEPFAPVTKQSGPQSATVYSLFANTEYFISVTLTNAGNWTSPTSYPLVVTTNDVTYPSICPMPVLVAATAGLIQLRLTPPLDTGGSDIFGYHIYVGVNGSMMEAAFTSITDAYLYESAPGQAWVPETTYDIQVIAMNELALCPSDNSARRSDALRVTIPPAQVPSSRSLGAYLVAAEASRLTLQVLLPNDLEGATPLGVYVTATPIVGSATTVLFPTTGAVVATIAGLNASTTYAIALQLLTSLGNTTERSNVLQATTAQGGLPAALVQTTALNVTASTAVVAWVYASDSGGGVLTEYQMQVNASSASVSPTWLPLPPSPVATISGLLANTIYQVTIRVRNIFGLVSPAAFALLTTANATVPGPPTSIAIASVSSTALQLAWRPPEDTGGQSDALMYSATVLADDNVVGACSSSTLFCTLYGLQPSTYFTVTVVASNALGTGAASAPIVVLTSAVTPPSAVLNLSTAFVSGGVINVFWSFPLDSGDGSSTLQYTVARNGAVVGSVSGATTYTDCGGILAGATYEYTVTAVNSVSAGPSASTTTVTSVMQPPMAPSISLVRAQATGLTFSFAPSCDTGGTNVLWHYALWYPIDAPMPLSPMLEIPSTASSFAVGGLTPSRMYTVVVWTSNYAGKSNLIMATATTTTGLPGLPSASLLAASTFTLSLALLPPANFTEDSWLFQATVSLAGRVVRNTTVPASAANSTVWSLTALDAATTYNVSLQVLTPQGASPVATAQFATLLDQPGVASFVMPAAYLMDGRNSTTLTLERLYGARGELVVPFSVSTAPTGLYPVCTTTGSATKCTFSATTSTTPSITFDAGNVTHALTLETWNSLVVSDVPHTINITLPSAENASTTAIVYLYGSSGSIQAPATVVLYENASTASIALARVGGVSGFLNATVTPLNGTAIVGVDVGVPPTSVVFAPRQTTGVILVTNISQSRQYNPSGRKFQLVLSLLPVGNVPPMPAVVVNVSVLDDPSIVKVPMLCGTVVMTQATGTTLTLQWSPPVAGVTPTSVYRVSVAGVAGTVVQSPIVVTSLRPGIVVYNLTPSSNYVVQVALANAAGVGPATPAQMFSTTPPTPPSSPQNASVSNVGGGVATLTWAPPNDTGGYPLSGYVVSAPRLPTVTLPVTTTYVAYDLAAVTSYVFAVSAITAPSMPTGAPVYVPVTTAAMELPSSPPTPVQVNATGGALSFTLMLPRNTGGGPILDVSLYLASGKASPVRACSGLQLSCTIYGLAFNTAYSVYTVATNALGASLPSRSQTVLTASVMSLPSAPATPVLVRVSGGTVWLSWTPPTDFGGTPLLTGYQVLLRANVVSVFGVVQWTASTVVADVALSDAVPPVSQLNITGLTNDTLYAFSIVALNPVSACRSDADSMPSPELFVRTLDPGAPTPPTFVVQVGATGGAVKIAWGQPYDNGGSEVTNYTLVRRVGSTTVVLAALPATLQSYQVYGLSSSTIYIFQVAAVNIVGASSWSDPLQATTSAPTPPTSPQSLQVASIGGGLVALAWQPPVDTGGDELVGYNVYRNALLISGQLNMTFFTDANGLSNGTTYLYTVSARSAHFEGGAASVSASTLATPDLPQPPVVSVLVVTGGMLLVQLRPPDNLGGQPLRALSILVVTTASGVVANVTTTQANSSFYGLSASTSYDIVASVSTSTGSSTPSTVRTTTLPLSVPSVPLEPQQHAVRGGSVDFWLRLPLDLGGGSVDMRLYQLDSTGALVTHVYKNATQAFAVTIPGLAAESLYQFWTTAVNAAGESVHSPVLNVMTTTVSAPGLVTGLTASSKSYRTLSLSWAVSMDTGGDAGGILGYNVTVASDAGVLQTLSTSVSAILIDGLVAATTYVVQVAAENVVSFGAWSAPVSFTTDEANPGELQMASATISVREDQGTVSITVLRTNGAAGDIGCNVTVTAISALLDVDFALPSTTSVEFPDGITFQSFSVPIFHDTVYNNLASFAVTLTDMTSATGSVGANAACTVYLLDAGDDGKVAFGSSVYTLNENATSFELSLVRTGGFSRAVTVAASVVGAPMVAFGSPTVVFADGQSSAVLVVRGIPNDLYDMPYRVTTIQLQIGAGSLGRLGSLSVASLRLLDEGDVSGANDAGLPPVFVNTTGGLLTVAVQPPLHMGGASQTIAFYALTTYQLPSMTVLSVQNQTTPTFVIGGLSALTSYAVSSAMWNTAGFPSMGASTVFSTSYTTGPVSLPGPPRNITTTTQTGGTVTVCWAPPFDTGGAPSTGNRILDASGLILVDNAKSASSCARLVGLNWTANSNYSVAVRLLNAAGAGVPASIDVSTGNVSRPTGLLPATTPAVGPDVFQVVFPLPGDTGGVPIQTYSLYINVTNSTMVTTEITTVLTQFDAAENTIVVSGLTALTWYQLLYTVTNANGTSDLSPPTYVRTSVPSIPTTPQRFALDPTQLQSGGCLSVQWAKPISSGGLPLVEYHVLISAEKATNFSVGAVVPSPALSTTLCGLTQNTRFTLKVIAYNSASYCYGSIDKLEASPPVTATTSLATLPLNQSAPLLQEATGGALHLVWAPPMDTGGIPIQTYLLYQVTSSGLILLANTSDQSYVVYGLAQSTSYQFLLEAQNAVGLSAPSPIAVVTTTSTTAPTAPRSLRVVNTTGGAVTLAWDPVLDTGGQPVNVYYVYRNGARIGQATTTLMYIDAGGLTASTAYSYIVVGFNGLQYGDQSSALTATTSTPTVPSACTSFNIALLGGEVSVNWSPGADTGGVPVLSYLATLMLSNSTIKAVVTATPTFQANFLLSRTNYTLSVQAVNRVGAGVNATVPTPTTQLSVPGDISTPPVLMSVFGGNATFLMTVPLNTGGGAQLSFVLYQGNRAAAQVSALNGSANATAYGLNASTAYSFTYACFNSLGLGGQSPSASATTLVANAPGPLALAPRVTAVTSRTITCAWQAPLDTGGSTLLVYELRAAGPSGVPTVSASTLNTLALTLLGLQYETAYTVQVRAWSTNQAASGPWSPPVTVSTASGSPGVFSFNTSAASVIKNATVLTVVLQRAVGTIGDVTVAVQAPNTTHLGTQFVLNASAPTQSTLLVAFPDGTASVVVPVGIRNDGIYRAIPSAFVLQLVSATGGASIGANNATMTVTLLDAGNAGKVRFAAANYDVADTVGMLSIPVLRYSGASTPIQVLAKTANNDSNAQVAAPGTNYRLPTTPLDFGDRQLTPTLLNITIRNTRIYSYPSLGFTVALSMYAGGAVLGDIQQVFITINNGNASSAPGAPPAPSVIMVTGGAVLLQVKLPINRGSAVATISSFSVTTTNVLTRVSTTMIVPYLNNPSIWIGGLLANTTYTLSLAAAQSAFIGYGLRSPNVTFTTGAASLATAPTNVAVASATGGALTLQWDLPLDTGGVPILNYRVQWTDASNTVQVVETGNAARVFVITGLVARRAYPVQIQCFNAVPIALTQGWGPYSAVASLSTTSATLPGPPILSSTPTATTGGSITVTWAPPLDTGGAPIVGYHVFFKAASASSFAQANSAGLVTQTRFAVAPLLASTNYSFLVLAENPAGPVLLPGVFNVSATATSVSTSMDCRQVLATGNAILLGTSLFTVGGAVTSSLFTVTQANAYATQLRVPGYRVGAMSNVITATTIYPTNPAVPPAPMLTVVTGGAMYATASSPADTGGIPVTGFEVLLLNLANGSNTTVAVGALVRSSPTALQASAPIRVQNLSPLSLYAVAVVAVNAVSGCSSYAPVFSKATSFTTTVMSTPGPPENLGVVLATGAGLSMVWSPPFDTGGASIDSYTLQMQDAPTSSWTSVYTGPSPAYRMAGLATSTTTGWRLRATNAVNTSLWSTPWNFSTTGPSVPGPCIQPYNVTTTGGRIEVAWAPPADSGGSPILSYLIARDDGAGGPFMWFAVVEPFYIAYGLNALTTYRFKVLAKNMIGSGEQSPIALLASGQPSPPELPAMPTVVAATGGAVSLQLRPPLDLGGVDPAALTYRVFANGQNVINVTYAQVLASQAATPPTTSRRLTVASSSSSVVVAGLDPSTVYQFGVAAVTPVGTSAPSALNAAVTQLPTAPVAPAAPTLVVAYGGSLQLSWLSPIDEGGSPVTSFRLVQLPSTTVCDGLIWSCIVPNLAPNTAYSFYVVAINAVGASPSSSVTLTKTILSAKPSAPRNVVVVSVAPAGTSALVAWDPPTSLGGLALSTYRVMYTNVNSGLGQTVAAGTDLNTTLTGLSTGTTYTVTLTAVNLQLDESPASYSASLKTPSGNGAPTAPTIACASSTRLGLVWMPVQGADRYALYRSGTLLATVSAPHFTDTGLTASTTYSYTLKSVDVHGAESVGVTASLATTATSDSLCTAAYGYVAQTAYTNNQVTQWTIAPSVAFSNLRLEVLRFDTECDHDSVRVEQFPYDGSRVLWAGGCTRLSAFFIWSDGALPVRITLRSDASVTKSGFSIRYIASTDAPVATAGTCPTTAGVICTDHGRCRTDGTCSCNLGFTGEDCSNRLVCCVDPKVCDNDICRLPSSQVLLVDANAGDDALGTGAMMSTSEIAGTAAKPFATLTRALQVATNDTTVFVYPGNYGAASCGHVFTERRVTITSLRGSNVTIVTCTGTFGLDITRCALVITGITLERATSASHGAGLLAHGSRVTFTDVVLQNTTAAGSGGGVFLDAQSVMTLNNSIIANATARLGGGVYLKNSRLFLTGAVITTNVAGYGAGIFTQDTGSISGDSASVLSHNTASVCGGGLALNGSSSDLAAITNVPITANAATNGGGACVLGGYTQIAWATTVVLDNFASGNGGGLYLAGAFVFNSSGSTFSSNHALGAGGGMYFYSATGAILADDALTVVQNQARAGGGVYTENSRITLTNLEAALNIASDSGGGIMGNASALHMVGANIVGNSAAVAGGGMHLVRASVATTLNVAVANNRATDGAGVSLDASALSDATIVGNTAMRYGGGVLLTAGATLTGCTVQGCSAGVNGGGVATVNSPSSIMTGVVVSRCSSQATGGGVAVLSSTLSLVQSPILENSATTDGGGLYIADGAVTGQVDVSLCRAGRDGGGIAGTGRVDVTGATIGSCTASRGGGLATMNAQLTLIDASISECSATDVGGAVYASDSRGTLQNAQLTHSKSVNSGGGLALSSSTLHHTALVISTCTSEGYGGGVALDASALLPVTPTDIAQITGNTAVGGGNGAITGTSTLEAVNMTTGFAALGGALYVSNGTASLQRLTLHKNTASTTGGGAYMINATVSVTATTVTSNRVTPGLLGGGLVLINADVSHASVVVSQNTAAKFGGLALGGVSRFVGASGASSVTSNNVCIASVCGNGTNIGILVAATATVAGVDVSGGRSTLGGSLYVDVAARLAVSHATISYNVAVIGGALYAAKQSSSSLTNVTLANNTATSGGGAIRIAGESNVIPDGTSVLTVSNITLFNNSASTRDGGAVWITHTTLTGSALLVVENAASEGNGGAFCIDLGSNVALDSTTVSKSRINADYNGGAFNIQGGSHVVLTNSLVSSSVTAPDSVASLGGLLLIKDALTSVVIEHSQLQLGYARSGGAIYIDGAALSISNSTVANCAATEFGGGLFITNVATVAMAASLLENCTANYNGGGVNLDGASQLALTNAVVRRNTAQDQGGAVFLDIGLKNALRVESSVFELNLASGLGSALFGSRDTATTIRNSTFRANGGVTIYGYNEGGVLYFETCTAAISTSTFERNVAYSGGALQMYSQATINVVDCVFQHNFAATDGGAVAQANGTLLLQRCLFFNNSALALGGALFLADAAAVMWDGTSILSNSAVRGGGVYLGDAASLVANDGQVGSNKATMGGGVYSTGQATVSMIGVHVIDNNASSTGGGFYMNSTSGIVHSSLTSSGNTAALGNDAFWRFDETTPAYDCAGCAFSAPSSLATDPMNITAGWWPQNVTSGVLMTTNASNVGPNLWSPNASTTPWPTILTVDYYGARSVLDTQTTCRLYKDLRESYAIDFTPAGQIAASAGFVTFAQAQVAATAKSSAFHFDAACTLYNDRQLAIDIYIQVNPCNPGYSLNAGKCIPCPQGSFSLDGINCHPCPMGATCLQSTVVGTGVAYTGVDYPSTQQGFFLNDAPASKMGALCDDASAFQSGDPCPGGTPETRLERIRSCLNASTFESYWPSERIFTCSSGYNFYTCSVASACKANIGKALVNSPGAKCAAGFRNVLCSSCDPGFEKLADGSCTECLPTASNAFYAYMMLPLLLVAVAILGAFLYLRAGTDRVLMAQARAAKADKPFEYSVADSDAPSHLERLVLRPLATFYKRVMPGKTLKLRATPANLFQIKRLRPPPVSINPEKLKILVSFFQIFASFKDTYDIEWPSDAAVFMQFFLKFNFSFLAIPHIDCVLRYNFYVDFELTLGITALFFALLYSAYRIGVLLYRRKLHRVPRHCPRCGLPNFDLVAGTAPVPAEPLSRSERLHRFVFEKHAAAPLLPTYAATHTQCPTTHVLESAAIRKQVVRTNLRLWQARLRLRLNFQTYCNKCWKIFFWLALVFYPAVSKKILDLFNCLEIGAGFYLVSDMNYLCYSSEWYLRAAIGAVGCVGWILGVPLTCFLILLRERHDGVRAKMKQLKDGKHELARTKWIDAMKVDYEANGLHWDERNMAFADDLLSRYMMKRNLRNPSVVAGVGFIYHAYKDEFWFFEIVDLVRKLFMNGVIVFVGQGSITQVVVGLIIIFIYMSILLAVQPYKEGSNNAVAAMAQMQLFVTLFAGLLVRMNVGNARSLNLNQVAVIIVVSNCTTISLILVGVLLEKIKEARLHKRICQRKYNDDVRFHIERLWWRATSYALADAYLAKVRTADAPPLPSFRVVLELARRQKASVDVDTLTTEVRDAEPAT